MMLAIITAYSPGSRSKLADGGEFLVVVVERGLPAGPDRRRGSKPERGEREAGGKQRLGRRQLGLATRPAHDQRAQTLADRARDHEIAEHRFAAAQTRGAHA
jgi:hypothetical protein